MRFKTYIIILTIPAIAWMLWAGARIIGLKLTGKDFIWPHGIVWNSASGKLHSELFKKETHQKKDLYLLRIVSDLTNEPVYEKVLPIEKGKGGGGFIMAAQVDTDPEPEVLYVTRTPEKNFYLDINGMSVKERPLEETSEDIKKRVRRFLMFYAPDPYKVGIALLVTALYYLAGFPGLLIFDMFKKRKNS